MQNSSSRSQLKKDRHGDARVNMCSPRSSTSVMLALVKACRALGSRDLLQGSPTRQPPNRCVSIGLCTSPKLHFREEGSPCTHSCSRENGSCMSACMHKHVSKNKRGHAISKARSTFRFRVPSSEALLGCNWTCTSNHPG